MFWANDGELVLKSCPQCSIQQWPAEAINHLIVYAYKRQNPSGEGRVSNIFT